MAKDDQKHDEYRERRAYLVKLCRMQVQWSGQSTEPILPDAFLYRVVGMSDHRRHSRDLVPSIGKMHAAKTRGRLPPATTCAETTDPAYHLSESDPGSECVRGPPPRQFVSPHDNQRGDNCADESPVKDPAGPKEIEREDLARVVAIKTIPFGNDHQQFRPDQRCGQHP